MAFMAGSQSEFITTPAVIEEVSHIKRASGAIDALIDSKALSLFDPDGVHLKSVVTAARATGDIVRLSNADISVLSLAFQVGGTLVSDDYAVANVAKALKIKVEHSLGKGLTEHREWTVYCSGCAKTFPPEKKVCPNCGNSLRRKYRKVRQDDSNKTKRDLQQENQ